MNNHPSEDRFKSVDRQREVVAVLVWAYYFIETKTDKELAAVLLERCSSLYGELPSEEMADLVWRLRQATIKTDMEVKL